MQDYTIGENYTLPSLGKVYNVPVNPEIKIRSMTTEEEMKRVVSVDQPYKNMSEIIDDCLLESPGISAYDMCIGDYQFLLHKLRVVTYGPEYQVVNTCTYCGHENEDVINLDEDNNKMVFVKKDFIMELIALIRVNTGERICIPFKKQLL